MFPDLLEAGGVKLKSLSKFVLVGIVKLDKVVSPWPTTNTTLTGTAWLYKLFPCCVISTVSCPESLNESVALFKVALFPATIL